MFIRWDSTRDPRPTRRLREKSREVVIAKCGQMFMPPSNGTFFGTLPPVKLWRFSRTELVNLVIDHHLARAAKTVVGPHLSAPHIASFPTLRRIWPS